MPAETVPACHGGGRGFGSHRSRKYLQIRMILVRADDRSGLTTPAGAGIGPAGARGSGLQRSDHRRVSRLSSRRESRPAASPRRTTGPGWTRAVRWDGPRGSGDGGQVSEPGWARGGGERGDRPLRVPDLRPPGRWVRPTRKPSRALAATPRNPDRRLCSVRPGGAGLRSVRSTNRIDPRDGVVLAAFLVPSTPALLRDLRPRLGPGATLIGGEDFNPSFSVAGPAALGVYFAYPGADISLPSRPENGSCKISKPAPASRASSTPSPPPSQPRSCSTRSPAPTAPAPQLPRSCSRRESRTASSATSASTKTATRRSTRHHLAHRTPLARTERASRRPSRHRSSGTASLRADSTLSRTARPRLGGYAGVGHCSVGCRFRPARNVANELVSGRTNRCPPREGLAEFFGRHPCPLD